MNQLPGKIGRYEVEAILGQGAMGIIYKGHDPEIDRPVAIKLVRADLLSGTEHDDYVARFRQEARAAGRCSHPNIVAVYDFSIHEGNPFLTMEFVEGINLGQAFDRGLRFGPAVSVAMMLQVLEGLAYAHRHGIVHRDIKPANIMVLPDGQVKVADFGISRLPGSELTQTGSVIGTPSYMSPEQCRGDAVDLRSDLFSTGAVLFQLLTGDKPFPGRNVTEIVFKLMSQDPQDLLERIAEVPAGIKTVLRRALEKRPEARFQSAREMAEALRLGVAGNAAIAAGDDSTVAIREIPRFVGFEGGSAPPADTPLDETAMRTLERRLAEHVGPMARLLVRNAAQKAGSIAELGAALAEHIAVPKERSAFLDQVRRLTGTATTATGIRPPAADAALRPRRGSVSAEEVAAAERDLARVLGPIARVLVQRAAPQAATAHELRQILSGHIKDEADRHSFVSGRSAR